MQSLRATAWLAGWLVGGAVRVTRGGLVVNRRPLLQVTGGALRSQARVALCRCLVCRAGGVVYSQATRSACSKTCIQLGAPKRCVAARPLRCTMEAVCWLPGSRVTGGRPVQDRVTVGRPAKARVTPNWTAGEGQGRPWTAGGDQGHPQLDGRRRSGSPLDGRQMSGSPAAGRSIWARVAGGRPANDRVTPGRPAETRVALGRPVQISHLQRVRVICLLDPPPPPSFRVPVSHQRRRPQLPYR